MNLSRLVLSRRNLILLFAADVVLWVIAAIAFNGGSNVDDVAWTIVFVVLAIFIVLGIVALVRSLRSRAR
jgi:membrane protein implicated in regulation of membrane protease activity